MLNTSEEVLFNAYIHFNKIISCTKMSFIEGVQNDDSYLGKKIHSNLY